jgi:pimeloyl-ACP methyl ester carboxylesterase
MNASWLECCFLRRGRVRNPGPIDNFIELKGAQVRYRLTGRGAPLVLVPDPPNTIEHYDGLVADLGRDHRVLCFDPPGFGFSFPRWGFRFTLSEQAEMLISLLEALDMHGCTLAIACLGAFAGMLAASRRPDLIDKLLLLQVASYEEMRAWTYKEDVARIIQTPVLGQVAMRFAKKMVVQQWYASALPENADADHYRAPTLAVFQDGGCLGLASAFQAIQRGYFEPARPIRQQTVVVWGTADRTHGETHKASILQHVPRATFLEYAGCGHFPDLENPEAYTALVRSLTLAGKNACISIPAR